MNKQIDFAKNYFTFNEQYFIKSYIEEINICLSNAKMAHVSYFTINLYNSITDELMFYGLNNNTIDEILNIIILQLKKTYKNIQIDNKNKQCLIYFL